MAWVKVNPNAGTGSATIALSVDKNNGRSTRTATVTYTVNKTGDMTASAVATSRISQSGASLITSSPKLYTGATSVTSVASATNLTNSTTLNKEFTNNQHKAQHYRVTIPAGINAYGAYIQFSGTNSLVAQHVISSVGFKSFSYNSGVESVSSVNSVESINGTTNGTTTIYNIGSSATDYGKYNLWGNCEILIESKSYTNQRAGTQTGVISLVYRTTSATTTSKVDLFKLKYQGNTVVTFAGPTGDISVIADGGQQDDIVITAPVDATWGVSGATLDGNLHTKKDGGTPDAEA